MPDNGSIATATTTINAPVSTVWQALIKPEIIKQYMFGADVVSDWQTGSSIIWKGEWQGKPYEDKGSILAIEEEHMLQYTHFSPLSGQPDIPENYHTVTVTLTGDDKQTSISLTQDNNATEQERQHSEENWNMMLRSLKELLEK